MSDTLERDPVTEKTLPPFYYVIFADGEMCDATGLEAAAGNDFVLFDDRLYMPGEDMVIEGREIFLSRMVHLVSPENGRHLTINSCNFIGRF